MSPFHPQYFSSYHHQFSRFLAILHHSCVQWTFHQIHSSVVRVGYLNISQFILTRDTGLHHCLIFRELIKWLPPDTTHCCIRYYLYLYIFIDIIGPMETHILHFYSKKFLFTLHLIQIKAPIHPVVLYVAIYYLQSVTYRIIPYFISISTEEFKGAQSIIERLL